MGWQAAMTSARSTATLGCAAALITLISIATVGDADAQRPARVAARCDRPCLEGLVADYLAAVVAPDPSHLPLASDASGWRSFRPRGARRATNWSQSRTPASTACSATMARATTRSPTTV